MNKTETISFSFQSTSRALFVYTEARLLAKFYRIEEKKISIQGNVVTIPKNFPFKPSAN